MGLRHGRGPHQGRREPLHVVRPSHYPWLKLSSTEVAPTLQRVGRQVDVTLLVGAGEIADRLGLAHVTSVHNLMRRHADFPSPVAVVGRVRIWVWPDIERWARATDRLPET